MEWRRGPHLVSDDPGRLDLDVIHRALSSSYWAEHIPRELVRRSVEGSLCFGLYDGERQLGLARVITDRATFAYLCDVFVVAEARGRGLGKFLLECVHAHPDLQGLRRWQLVTRDAHGLYRHFGWQAAAEPERHMEIVRRHAYADGGR